MRWHCQTMMVRRAKQAAVHHSRCWNNPLATGGDGIQSSPSCTCLIQRRDNRRRPKSDSNLCSHSSCLSVYRSTQYQSHCIPKHNLNHLPTPPLEDKGPIVVAFLPKMPGTHARSLSCGNAAAWSPKATTSGAAPTSHPEGMLSSMRH